MLIEKKKEVQAKYKLKKKWIFAQQIVELNSLRAGFLGEKSIQLIHH